MTQLYLMGTIYTILGVVHFTHTGFYRPLMPKFMPAHDLLIFLKWSSRNCSTNRTVFPTNQKLCSVGYNSYVSSFFISSH